MSENKLKLQKNIIINMTMELITGLHIGGNKEDIQIGGIDDPIIKDPYTGIPYIPGSTIKGKMRALIEYSDGKYDTKVIKNKKNKVIDKVGRPHSHVKACNDPNCRICTVFGSTNNTAQTGITRLIVRDAPAIETDIITELKVENTIDRIKGSAISPRTMERVPAGTKFKVEFVYSIYGQNNDEENFSTIKEALLLLEDSYLGGSGTRGYGKVKIHVDTITVRTSDDYKNTINEIIGHTIEIGKPVSEWDGRIPDAE